MFFVCDAPVFNTIKTIREKYKINNIIVYKGAFLCNDLSAKIRNVETYDQNVQKQWALDQL